MTFKNKFAIIELLFFSLLISTISASKTVKMPNIVLIVADDLGYSDLGCFGSEIATPNIDGLAHSGFIFNNFYTAPTCSPTRAMLLTGTDNHIAGLGNMAERAEYIPEQKGKPGYEGYLNDKVLSVAQVLRDKGYHTYISGKWHLGYYPDQSPKSKGFERSFCLLNSDANHFYPDKQSRYYWGDNSYVNYPDGQYSTDVYTDKLIRFVKEDQGDDKPFFLIAAYTSPHWPLQAPKEYIDKYEGVYNIGYDSLRNKRIEGLKNRGIIPKNTIPPILPKLKGTLYQATDQPLLAWNSLSAYEKKIEARKMEIYAAMVDNMDYNIGRLISYLKSIDEYDNTLFVFFSDNGAAVSEANVVAKGADLYQNMGTYNSFVAYGPQWAHASSASNRLYKGYTYEGGIHSPMIVKMPYQTEGKGVVSAFSTVMDMYPSFLDLASAEYPKRYNGKSPSLLKGESILPLLKGEKDHVHKDSYVMGWELFNRCALRKGNWKIVQIESPFGQGNFELFDLLKDPSESNDLSATYPKKYKEMIAHWKDYVTQNGVILLND